MSTLLFLRGLPGSGKTTLGELLSGLVSSGAAEHIEADRYFEREEDGRTIYAFDPAKLREAHEYCEQQTVHALDSGIPLVIVSNTSTHEWEVNRYRRIADSHGARFISVIVENRHSGQSVHDVPSETLTRMRERFDLLL
jgi:predicted kinase